MRGTVDGLPSPYPLGLLLPGIYQEDDLAQRLVAGLDEVLAPVLSTLDNLGAYVDPRLAPEDFVDWLSTWVGVVLDEDWSLERSREIVARAVALHRRRGTARGILEAVRLVVDGEVELLESGGARWSSAPDGDLPGQTQPWLRVRVRVADPDPLDARRLEAVVAAVKPAHVPHTIELVAR